MKSLTSSRADRSPSRGDLKWIAGFLEGEAHFGYQTARGQRVMVTNTDLEPLEELREFLGGGIYPKKQSHPPTDLTRHRSHWSPAYSWETYGARARGIMMTVYSLMKSKRRREIREALMNLHVPRTGRGRRKKGTRQQMQLVRE